MTKNDLTTPGAVIRNFVLKTGKSGQIRVIDTTDFEELLIYANNLINEDTYVAISGKPLTRRYEKAYLKKTVHEIKNGQKVHLIALVDNRFAGSFEIRLREKRSAHVGEIGIGLAPEFRGEGLGTIAMETLVEAAGVMNLRLLTLTCFAVNKKAVKLYRKMGFYRGGLIPGMYQYRGRFEPEIIMYKKLVS